MTADELAATLIDFFGAEADWRGLGASKLRVTRATLNRWLAGSVAIPGPVEAWVEGQHEIRAMKQRRRDLVNASYARRKAREQTHDS